MDDIPVLAQNLLDGINRSMHSSYHLHKDVFNNLKQYSYPGNVRELRNILFIAATHCHDREIDVSVIEHVIANMPHCNKDGKREAIPAEQPISNTEPEARKEKTVKTLKGMEEQHIKELLDRYGGNRKLVADALGISERTIYRKLKRLGVS
jgi:DNA-binding NtrC family response regulator